MREWTAYGVLANSTNLLVQLVRGSHPHTRALAYLKSAADHARAMAFLREQVDILHQNELFNSLPPFPVERERGSAGNVIGGGSIAGPSPVASIDMSALLEECGQLPPSLLDSTGGWGR